MANYPASLPSLTNPAGTDSVAGIHAALESAQNDEIEAIAAVLGLDIDGPYAASLRERLENSAYKNWSCRSATVQALPAVTYANGTAGVGATLTATANGVMAAVDGVTPAVNDRMLVKNQAAPLQNGIYTVTSVGAVGAPFVLTRAIDADTSAKAADMKVLIDGGIVNADTEWYCSATAPVMGTDGLYFRRSQPIYGHGNPRSPWAPNVSFPAGAQPIMETMPRVNANGTITAGATAIDIASGGIVCPAGRTVTSLNFIYSTALATITTYWVALIKLTDRTVVAVSANSTTAWAAPTAIKTTNFAAPWTPVEDTPVYACIAMQATTAAVILGLTYPTTMNTGRAPILVGTTTAPTSTPPTVGTALAALTAVTTFPYIWLT